MHAAGRPLYSDLAVIVALLLVSWCYYSGNIVVAKDVHKAYTEDPTKQGLPTHTAT